MIAILYHFIDRSNRVILRKLILFLAPFFGPKVKLIDKNIRDYSYKLRTKTI